MSQANRLFLFFACILAVVLIVVFGLALDGAPRWVELGISLGILALITTGLMAVPEKRR